MRGGEPWQLFDLREDPYEQENLLEKDVSKSLAQELHGYLRNTLAETDDLYPLKPAFGHDGLNLPLNEKQGKMYCRETAPLTMIHSSAMGVPAKHRLGTGRLSRPS